MTVTNSTARGDYNCNGSTQAFSIPFQFFLNTEIQVLKTDTTVSPAVVTTLALTTDYTVTGGAGSTGTFTTVATFPTGIKLSVLPNLPFTQQAHYVPNDPFPAETHEQALDRLDMQDIQLNEKLGRAAVLPPTVQGVNPSLPVPLANAALVWDPTGTFLTNGASTVASVAAFNGRTGAVVPASGDYTASQITGLAAFIAANGVASFSGRNGTVVPTLGDYPASLIPFTQAITNAKTSTVDAKLDQTWNFLDWAGSNNDGGGAAGGSISSGSAALTLTGATFTSADVGKAIQVPGAGAAGVDLLTTIQAFVDSTHVTLAATAGTTVSSVTCYYGTDNGTALNNALAWVASHGGELVIPAGTYITTQTPYLNCSSDYSILIRAAGARVIAFGAVSAFKVSNTFSPNHVTVQGLKVLQLHNQLGVAGIEIYNGLHVTLRDCVVQTDGSNAAYLPYWVHGVVSGGSYWCAIENCNVRLTGSGTPTVFCAIQGYANATTLRGCSFLGTSGTTVMVNILANGGGDTYIPNAVLIDGNWFEQFLSAVQVDGTGAVSSASGLRVVNNRTESGTNLVSFIGTSVQPAVPALIQANYRSGTVTNLTNNPSGIYYNAFESDSAGNLVVSTGVAGQGSLKPYSLMVQPASGASVAYISRLSGQNGYLSFYYAPALKERWRLVHKNDTETGSNTGSSWSVQAIDDSGALIDEPVLITRASGAAITLGGSTKRPTILTGFLGQPVGGAVASASAITPTGTIFHITGTTTVNTINLPYTGFTGSIQIIPDAATPFGSSGNIATATVCTLGKTMTMTYDGTKWYPSY